MTQRIETAGVDGCRLFHRDFSFWYLARSISVAGTAASAVALPLLVYRTSASPTWWRGPCTTAPTRAAGSAGMSSTAAKSLGLPPK